MHSISTIHQWYHTGKQTPESYIRSCLETIIQEERSEQSCRAFITVDAAAIQKQVAQLPSFDPTRYPLYGIPIAVKDNIHVEGFPTTCASHMLADFLPYEDAYAIKCIKQAGAIIIGKTNMDEFGMGSSTEYSVIGSTSHPLDSTKTAGGSSGGSAVAVAKCYVPIALGSDTGGSVRQPAAFCGIYGLKPTYGAVSRNGLVAFASSFDQIGIFANQVDDLERTFQLISSLDPGDMTCIGGKFRLDKEEQSEYHSIRIGICPHLYEYIRDPSIYDALQETQTQLESLGMEVVEVSIPEFEGSLAAYYILANSEASSNLARFDGLRYGKQHFHEGIQKTIEWSRDAGFGSEVKRRILLGTYALLREQETEAHKQSRIHRNRLEAAFKQLFTSVDALLLPTTPEAAFDLGSRLDSPVYMYQADIFTVLSSLTGGCALSIPRGLNEKGLPIGLQILGDHFQERMILEIAHRLEQ